MTVCLECGNPRKASGKYCSLKCQMKHQYRTVIVPKIESGQVSLANHRRVIVRYLTERDGYKCSNQKCGISDWMGSPISLDVDHVDGNNKNNKAMNFRLLCPNCHRQTPTWGFRGRGNKQNTFHSSSG